MYGRDFSLRNNWCGTRGLGRRSTNTGSRWHSWCNGRRINIYTCIHTYRLSFSSLGSDAWGSRSLSLSPDPGIVFLHIHVYVCMQIFTYRTFRHALHIMYILGLYKIFVCLFGDYALVNTILSLQHLLDCTPSRCIVCSILRNTWSPPAPACFAI